MRENKYLIYTHGMWERRHWGAVTTLSCLLESLNPWTTCVCIHITGRQSHGFDPTSTMRQQWYISTSGCDMGKERKLRMKDGRILQVASRWNKSQVGRSHCRCFTSWLGLTGEYIERYKMGRQFWSFKKNAKVVKKSFLQAKKPQEKWKDVMLIAQ